MPVMDVGVVRVRVCQRLVYVGMCMGFTWRIVRSMFVLVMLVVDVSMAMLQPLMFMQVLVPLS